MHCMTGLGTCDAAWRCNGQHGAGCPHVLLLQAQQHSGGGGFSGPAQAGPHLPLHLLDQLHVVLHHGAECLPSIEPMSAGAC